MTRHFRHLLRAALLACTALALGRGAVAHAQATDARGVEFFESRIRPVLVNHCYECHSAEAQKTKKFRGGLLLDTREGLRKGGDAGPVIVPGNPGKSLLIQSLHHQGDLKMPPKGKLPANVVSDFELWVKMGAPDPREGKTAAAYKTMTREEARTFWAFQPVRKPAPPRVRDASWPRSDMDRFVLARLEQKGMRPVGDAERLTLLRRLHFDLVGLPPSPEAQETFLKDNSAQAVEKVVDALLASPQYGERWGRHWLDVARYAESNGNADNILFPHAWRYRDYVIRAFNQDKAFDRFITEQIAGDLMPAQSPEERDDQLIATGFLSLTSRPRAQNNPDYRMDLIADQIDVTARAFLGLTVLCARCHDHKFDFIPTKEYYSLAGIFDSSEMVPGGGVKGAKMVSNLLHALSSGGQAMGAREGRPADTQVCIRGESKRPGETVKRGFITLASPEGKPPLVSNRNQSGRTELTKWIASPDNPLTARVAVNRLWVHLFGEGIVRTPDNFGSLGERPSHPELLDYLAARLVENGWSLKKTIKEIVLSRTYQLASAHSAANYKADPDNVLLWRMSPRRLEAEAIRDAILSVSGRLVLNPPARSLADGAPGKKGLVKKGKGMVAFDTNHRGVYLPILRNYLPEILDLFDAANPSLVVGKREVTTVPAQALFLMNSPFATENARAAAERLLAAPNLDDAGRVDLGYRLALGRPATAAERERALTFIRESAAALGTARTAQVGAWSAFCQTLFASAEFRYVQ